MQLYLVKCGSWWAIVQADGLANAKWLASVRAPLALLAKGHDMQAWKVHGPVRPALKNTVMEVSL